MGSRAALTRIRTTKEHARSPLPVSIPVSAQRVANNSTHVLPADPVTIPTQSIVLDSWQFIHDFSRIPVHPKTTVTPQVKFTLNAPDDSAEQEADAIADQVTGMSDPEVSLLPYHPSPPNPSSALTARGSDQGSKRRRCCKQYAERENLFFVGWRQPDGRPHATFDATQLRHRL